MSHSLQLVATASQQGTLVRVFDINRKVLIHEVRRGLDQAHISSLSFSRDSSKLLVASDKVGKQKAFLK